MRTITIQADGPHLDAIMEEWLAHLVRAIPVGPHGIKFDGGLHDGIIVNHRSECVWTVSFRPSPGGSRSRAYANPAVVARVIIAGEHDETAAVILAVPARDVTAGTQAAMEHAFSEDFSAVRVHTGDASNRVAAGLSARALTAGQDIVFRSGAFQPHTPSGDRLLAHELAHVVQQRQGLATAAIDKGASEPLKQAADTAAQRAVDPSSAAARPSLRGLSVN